MKKNVLCFLLLVVFIFVFTPIRSCFGDEVMEDQYVSTETDHENYSFKLKREKSTLTGRYVHTNEIPFSYNIVCKDSLYNTIKTYEGSGTIPEGGNSTVIDVREIAEEMKEKHLAKSYTIEIELDVTKMDNANYHSGEDITLSIEDIFIPGSPEYFEYIESMIHGNATVPDDDEDPDEEEPEDGNGIAEAINENVSGKSSNILTIAKTVLYIAGGAIVIGAVIGLIIVLSKKKR